MKYDPPSGMRIHIPRATFAVYDLKLSHAAKYVMMLIMSRPGRNPNSSLEATWISQFSKLPGLTKTCVIDAIQGLKAKEYILSDYLGNPQNITGQIDLAQWPYPFPPVCQPWPSAQTDALYLLIAFDHICQSLESEELVQSQFHGVCYREESVIGATCKPYSILLAITTLGRAFIMRLPLQEACINNHIFSIEEIPAWNFGHIQMFYEVFITHQEGLSFSYKTKDESPFRLIIALPQSDLVKQYFQGWIQHYNSLNIDKTGHINQIDGGCPLWSK